MHEEGVGDTALRPGSEDWHHPRQEGDALRRNDQPDQ
jgi:hypothetical protein